MDPFTEKEIVDCLKSIALSLKKMEVKLDDISVAIKEFGADVEIEEIEDDFDGESEEGKEDEDGKIKLA